MRSAWMFAAMAQGAQRQAVSNVEPQAGVCIERDDVMCVCLSRRFHDATFLADVIVARLHGLSPVLTKRAFALVRSSIFPEWVIRTAFHFSLMVRAKNSALASSYSKAVMQWQWLTTAQFAKASKLFWIAINGIRESNLSAVFIGEGFTGVGRRHFGAGFWRLLRTFNHASIVPQSRVNMADLAEASA